ncbi:trypsin alpha-3-like [Toxorhynchites rutilus septentrionalis]|uniref:trypsin alpha-3-like n=1 Tax=Toxorhynchites rutilus septentrionalis TaxID=329112 RepID=UPI00247AF811|nr:trypsin alpha-3-like [Toxorhynchites rutilus septentrionalis]
MCSSVVMLVITLLCFVSTAWADESRIVGGANATGNVCPHTVAIRLVGKDFHCNGALVSNQDVLTAAQCVYSGNVVRNASEFQVVLGTIVNSNNVTGSTVRTVRNVWPHSSFKPNTLGNDIAVLRLNSTVQSSSVLAPVRLGSASPAVNQTCSVCGWGSNVLNGKPATTLQRIDFRMQAKNSSHCVRTGGGVSLKADMICAGDLQAGRGACTGDLGAPMVCGSFLQGVLSIVGGCGRLNETSIFTDTAAHLQWINNRTQADGSNPGGNNSGGGTPGGNTPGGNNPGAAANAVIQFGIIMVSLMCSLALR